MSTQTLKVSSDSGGGDGSGSNSSSSLTTTDESLETAEDDEYYMRCLSEILDTSSKSSPPAHPTRLTEHLYIGNQDNADDVHLLSALDITHVLNMAGTRTFDLTRSPYKSESGIRAFLMMPTEDYEEFDMTPYLLDALAFLARADTSDGRAFVHCNYGVNRSGIVAAAYMMTTERKPLLRVANDLKARRSLVLTNVGFRRQLVKFARCRGLLDKVERPSRRSPRLTVEDKSPRAVTPVADKVKDEFKDECSEVRATLKNGYHVPVSDSCTLSVRVPPPPSSRSSRRDQLIRDVDSTLGAFTSRDITGPVNFSARRHVTSYRSRDEVHDHTPSPEPDDSPRLTRRLILDDYVDMPSLTLLPVTSQYETSDAVTLSDTEDDDDDQAASSLDCESVSYTPGTWYRNTDRPSTDVLNDYEQTRPCVDALIDRARMTSAVTSRHLAPPAMAKPFVSQVKPRSFYSRQCPSSSAIDDYDEADIASFLAECNAFRATPAHVTSRRRVDDVITRNVAALDVYSGGSSKYRPSVSATVLPTSTYVGRYYRSPSVPSRPSIGRTSAYVIGLLDDDDLDDVTDVGRVVATRVTPAPALGRRIGGYFRSQSAVRRATDFNW